MSDYNPPVKDMMFLLNDLYCLESDMMDAETIEAVLDEASKLAAQVLAPLNVVGDQEGATLEGDAVKTAKGFKDAYQQYAQGGWNAVPFDDNYGGQGLPWGIAFPIQEMWQSANMAFGLCPLLNQGAIEAIHHHGNAEQKDYYLPKLISGEWTGTMNLTEPHAGSDLGLLRARAEKQDDGSYKITGQKIWITYGEHDFTENIIHLVLARCSDAPEDVKGISLFVVPKFLEDGTRNDLKCIGLDHKLGIHGSPTCVMQFGDQGGATGYLVGKENRGLKYMFTMMNNARLSVGLQGVSIAERAYQHASAYAADRVQGKSFKTGERVSIDQHVDVQRMLLSMRSQIEAGRALTYDAALTLDKASDGDTAAQAKVDLLVPIVKAWCTDMACEVTSTGVQIHGGMGFIEETGAAQYYRDARILPIYEGTNGIQALDLMFRKIVRDKGAALQTYIEDMRTNISDEDEAAFASSLSALNDLMTKLTRWAKDEDHEKLAAAASPFLKGFGYLAGGALLSRSSSVAKDLDDQDFAQDKMRIAAFYVQNILPLAEAHLKIAAGDHDFFQ